MELIGKLKNKVDQAASKEEARELIEQAGILLTDEEMEIVSGGQGFPNDVSMEQLPNSQRGPLIF